MHVQQLFLNIEMLHYKLILIIIIFSLIKSISWSTETIIIRLLSLSMALDPVSFIPGIAYACALL